MKKRPFLLFSMITGVLILCAILFIQSNFFGNLVKDALVRYIPSDSGVSGDFSSFSVKILPPGLSIEDPKVKLSGENILGLPANSTVVARRIDLVFLPLQMLSGNIRVNRVLISDGELQLSFSKDFIRRRKTRTRSERKFGWEQLFEVKVDALVLKNTGLKVNFEDPEVDLRLMADHLHIEQSLRGLLPGYRLNFDVRDLYLQLQKSFGLPENWERVSAEMMLNSNGIQLEKLDFATDGIEAAISGRVKGDVLKPKQLSSELTLSLLGDFERIRARLPVSVRSNLSNVSGKLKYKGKLNADLLALGSTLEAEGNLAIENFAYDAWRADRLEAEGTYNSELGGSVSVRKAMIQEKRVARKGGVAGGGGVLKVEPFVYEFGTALPLEATVSIEDSHLHWLAAPALKSLYGLDFRTSGQAIVRFNPQSVSGNKKKSWEIETELDLSIPQLQLDNQKLGQNGSYTPIVSASDLGLKGLVKIDGRSVEPQGLELILPGSRVQVGGRVSYNNGYDLKISGPVDLSDVEGLAESQIYGKGLLDVLVVGPASDVSIHFDTKMNEVTYLNLAFGALKGRITWQDHSEQLIFDDLEATKGVTTYQANGKLSFKNEATIDLRAVIRKGNVQNLVQIFQNLTKDLWWFPRSIYGETTGTVHVTGGLDLQKLRVLGQLSGRNWEHFGERFQTVKLSGGYDQGLYLVSNVEATKRTGNIKGRISAKEGEHISWDLETSRLSLAEFDNITRLEVPIRGELKVFSRGKGPFGKISSETLVKLTKTAVRGQFMPPSELSIKSSEGLFALKGSALGGQGVLDAEFSQKPKSRSFVKGKVARLDFSPLLLLLNPRHLQDHSLRGYITGEIDISFPVGEPDRGDGTFRLDEYVLAKRGSAFSLAKPVEAVITDGDFTIREMVLRGGGGDLRLDLSSRKQRLAGKISGGIDSRLSEFVTSLVESAQGVASVDIDVSGKLTEPQFFGRARLRDASLQLEGVDSSFQNIEASLDIEQNVITLIELESDLSGGRFTAEGELAVFASRMPRLDFRARLSGNRLKVYPLQVARLRGTLHAHGESFPYAVDGNLTIDSGLIREKVMNQRQGRQILKTARYMPTPAFGTPGYSPFLLNLRVVANNTIEVQNDLFDAKVKADVRVVNTLEAPRLLGMAEITQGTLSFKDRVFQIQSGRGEFDSPTTINPKINLLATTDVGSTKIQLFVNGRVDAYRIELSSNPSLPENEILSLLALGLTSEELSVLRSGDRSAYEQGEAASLLLHSLNFNREVQDKTGFEIQLDEAVTNNQQGTSIFRPREGDPSSAPKLVIKRRITKNIDVSVGSTVGVGTNSQREVNAEYKIPFVKGLTFRGTYDDRTDPTNTQDAQNTQNRSFGVDLMFQKRFE